MKRRDFLKNLAIVGGSTLYSRNASSSTSSGQAAELRRVRGIRGLVEKENKYWQPIQISISNVGQKVEAILSVDGVERGRQVVGPATQTLEILVPPVEKTQNVEVRAQVGSDTFTSEITLKPVRRVRIFILPHSHTDIGYTDLQSAVDE